MHRPLFVFVSAVLLAACGGKPAPAQTPTPSNEAEVASASKAQPSPSAEPAAAGSGGTPEAEKKPEETGPRPTRSPIDTIAAPKLAFVINYGSSAPNQAAEKRCGSSGDPKARAQCMSKERSDFTADVIQFKKDKSDKYWWITYRRKGSALTELSRTPIEFVDETVNTVAVKIADGDKKPRVLFSAKNKFVVTVPNDYSLEVDDPRYGKLVYDAKIDVVGQGE